MDAEMTQTVDYNKAWTRVPQDEDCVTPPSWRALGLIELYDHSGCSAVAIGDDGGLAIVREAE